MLLRQFVLPGLLLPALVAGAIAICDPALFRRGAGRGPRTGGPALAGAFVATFAAIGAVPSLPPAEVLGWSFWLVAAAGLCGIFWESLPRPARAGGAIALGFALSALTLRPLAAHTWSASLAAAWVAAAAVLTLIPAWGFHRLARADQREAVAQREGAAAAPGQREAAASRLRGGWCTAAAALVLTAGAAATLGLSASARLAQLMGAATAGLAACVVARLVARSHHTLLGPGAVLPLALGYAALLLNGFFYAELRWTAWVALGLAPAVAALARRRAGGRRALLAVLLVVAGLVVVALAPAIWATVTTAPGELDYY